MYKHVTMEKGGHEFEREQGGVHGKGKGKYFLIVL